MTTDMKRVLIITYYWPPTAGSGVQRWLKMSKYLPEYGWMPVIYTPENPDVDMIDESLLEDIREDIEIIKRPILEPYALFNLITRKKSTGSGAVNPINSSSHKSKIMRIAVWIRANLFIPDPRCFWIRSSVRFLKKYLRDHPVDAIVSTGPPHSMHLIAKALHHSTGIPWTADFRDPWTRIFYFKHLPLTRLSAKRYSSLELSVLREANHVVTVTELIAQEFIEELGEQNTIGSGKFHVIENGYDEQDFASVRPASLPDGFNLVHTGLFSSDGNPRKLWKVLREMSREIPGFADRLHLTFAGKTDPEIITSINEAGLSQHLTNLGYVSHHEANSLQKAADLLLLPLREEPEVVAAISGKYFEYLAAGRPIAAFGPHDSVLERSLTATNTGKMFDWDEEIPLKAYVTALYTRTLAFEPNTEAISAYTRRSLAGRYAAILNDLTK